MTQQEAFEVLKSGENVFLTGYAGSGKTFLLNKYISYLKSKRKKAAVTASTGVAATHINGMTIQAWTGIGIRETITYDEIVHLLKRKYLHKRFKKAEVLIIDEVSMLSGSIFEAVNQICQAFKRNNKPFGGMQVVLSGDFFQLPPIVHGKGKPDYLFHSEVWHTMNVKVCYLESPFRHDDSNFLQILHSIRTNTITTDTWQELKKCFFKSFPPGIVPTRLFTHNAHVDYINNRELKKIPGEEHVFTMKSFGKESLIQTMKKSCLAPEFLKLKKGAFVMFVKNNFENGYVNGTLGKVIDFSSEGFPVVETYTGKKIVATPVEWLIEEDGKVEGKISQIPLRLAWAITIHKSQGMTLDAAEIDLGKSFVLGMGYVALSRVRSLQSIRLLSLNKTALSVHPRIIEFDQQLKEWSRQTEQEIHGMWEKEMLGAAISPHQPSARQKGFQRQGRLNRLVNPGTSSFFANSRKSS